MRGARLLFGIALGVVALLLAPEGRAAEADGCRRALTVVGARATYRTPVVAGQVPPRVGEIEVELSSTSTTPIALVELALFLGASLKAIEETRASALPTARPRELEDGGLAFRAEVSTFLRPGVTRTLRVMKTDLPGDRDLSSVTAQVIGCRAARAVDGVSTLAEAESESNPPTSRLVLAAVILAFVLATIVLVRALR